MTKGKARALRETQTKQQIVDAFALFNQMTQHIEEAEISECEDTLSHAASAGFLVVVPTEFPQAMRNIESQRDLLRTFKVVRQFLGRQERELERVLRDRSPMKTSGEPHD